LSVNNKRGVYDKGRGNLCLFVHFASGLNEKLEPQSECILPGLEKITVLWQCHYSREVTNALLDREHQVSFLHFPRKSDPDNWPECPEVYLPFFSSPRSTQFLR